MVGRAHDATGRSTGRVTGNARTRKAMRPPPDQPWVWLSRDLMESYAWRALTANGRRLIDRVMLEHMGHGGAENGALTVTYADLAAWGIRLNSVAPTIAEVVALGLIEHRPGRASHIAGKGHSQVFKLAWLPDCDGGSATEGWRRFESMEAAAEMVKVSRSAGIDAKHNRMRSRCG